MINMYTLTAVATGFIITLIMGVVLIPFLKRLKFGQTIKEIGPTWHAKKQGTPTMGGIMFIVGVVLATTISYAIMVIGNPESALEKPELTKLFAGLSMAFLFALIGFIDDYIKVVKKQNLGLRAKQKLVLQVIVTALYLLVLYMAGDHQTIVNVPFLGQWNFGYLYYPIMGILIIGIVNSANLTDGVDGLLGSVTFVIAILFMIVTAVLKSNGMNILASALAASLIAFLMFNMHPAKVFMGDTGSFFLGGVVIALAFGLDMPLILFFVGFIYCVESLSVILQVISFKSTGKRIFRMSPIHHHFEMGGMSENKVVSFFSAITAIMCLVSFFALIKIGK